MAFINTAVKHYLLLIDSARIDNTLSIIYQCQGDPAYGYLFENTAFDHVKKQGAIWVQVSEKDGLWRHWLSKKNWAESGIVIGYQSAQKHSSIIQQLQSRLVVLSPDLRPLYLRFFSPTVMSVLLTLGTEQEKTHFLGVIDTVMWQTNIDTFSKESYQVHQYHQNASIALQQDTFILSNNLYQGLDVL